MHCLPLILRAPGFPGLRRKQWPEDQCTRGSVAISATAQVSGPSTRATARARSAAVRRRAEEVAPRRRRAAVVWARAERDSSAAVSAQAVTEARTTTAPMAVSGPYGRTDAVSDTVTA